ncbi:4-hydroxybenzoate polyprenyl transferase [Pholiota molesta]|nr:4-hydroxybenzoate polyprenyl transferase [Pholiota molesta]
MSISIHSLLLISRPWIELARLNKPAGALLIIWPYVWGLSMAAAAAKLPVLSFLKYLIVGSIWFLFVRSTGCIWNDIIDRNIDRLVERTKHRPLATGRTSVVGALIFLCLHLMVLSSLLALGNRQIRVIGLVTLYPLAGGYPFIKRVSYWPQAWLGVAFNTGTFMSWACVAGSITQSSIHLIVATWFWTMWYDTIYGSQDKKDDINIGVKSTALLFKSTKNTKQFLAFHAFMFIGFLTTAGLLNQQSAPYFIGVCILGVHLAFQFWHLDLDSPKSCLAVFSNSGYIIGPIIAIGSTTDYFYRQLYL